MKKNKKIMLIIGILTLLFLSGCIIIQGSGNVKNESRSVSGFTEVILTSSGNLDIKQTGTESLLIEAEDNILSLIETDIVGDRLSISIIKNAQILSTKPINYWLTVKDIKTLMVSGSGKAEALNVSVNNVTITGSGKVILTSNADNINVLISGSGDAEIRDINVENLKVIINGSGKVIIIGKANNQDILISGSGKYDAEKLDSKSARIDITGSGTANVNATDSIYASISGSGQVKFIGNPDIRGPGKEGIVVNANEKLIENSRLS